jgi:hypothetical protein
MLDRDPQACHSFTDLPDPTFRPEDRESFGHGFKERFSRHTYGVLDVLEVTTMNGTVLEGHEEEFIIFAFCSSTSRHATNPRVRDTEVARCASPFSARTP